MEFTQHDISQARSEGVQMGIEVTCNEINDLLNIKGLDKIESNALAIERVRLYINNKLGIIKEYGKND